MWSALEDYDLPHGEHLVEPMRASLTPDTRKAILKLKELRSLDSNLQCPSVDLYRAVIDDGVRTTDDLHNWLKSHKTGNLTDWKPKRKDQ
jgi:hypothetical protein